MLAKCSRPFYWWLLSRHRHDLEGQVSTRRLGNSDLNISPVGFGAWAIGGTGYDFAWGKQDDADSIAAVHRSLELGVNWIDTAPVYGTGHSEEIVASALK